MEIPLPPLAEQKRIVAILDEAFKGIDEAKANAEAKSKFTKTLFESHLQTIFTQQGAGWVERRLSELSQINYGYTESASPEKIGPHFLRITDIQDGVVDWSTVPYCSIDKADLPKYKLADGDIVFARTGATTGKSYLVSNPPDSIFASYLIRVQLSNKVILPEFLCLFFQTRSYWDVIRAGVSGSTQGGFNASKLGELTISYPASLNDQKVLIQRILEIQKDTLKAGKLMNQKIQALAEVRSTLLAQAFAGELTA
jgi:type I restriction enzyme S subunit